MPAIFPKWLYHFMFPSAMKENSTFSTFLSILGIVNLFILATNGCAPLLFWFTCPWWLVRLSTFLHAYWQFIYCLWENWTTTFASQLNSCPFDSFFIFLTVTKHSLPFGFLVWTGKNMSRSLVISKTINHTRFGCENQI